MKRFPLLGLMLLVALLVGGCAGAPTSPVVEAPPPVTKPQTPADSRIAQLRSLIASQQKAPELRKLELVNGFFNSLVFEDDIIHWGVQDYWATPLETVRSDGGDCEDFVIGKYFTLRELKVPEKRLRLTYVRAGAVPEAHMILAYYATPDAEPLILDNLISEIRISSRRPDLVPIFSFNAEGLWVAGQKKAALDDPSSRLSHWRDVLRRIEDEQHPP